MYTINLKINKLLSIWLISMFFIIALMIVVGGLTRLTDSGLSITEWQLFSGILPPLNNDQWIMYFNLYKEIPEFKLQNFNMTMQDVCFRRSVYVSLCKFVSVGRLLASKSI